MCVAIVLLFTALLLSGCLGGVPCCCDARGGGGSVLWRLCYYLQHFCSPAAMVCVAVLLCCSGGKGDGSWRLCYYLQHFCCAAALVCVLCCCVAKVLEGGGAWRLCYYLQHFCSPADLVWCARSPVKVLLQRQAPASGEKQINKTDKVFRTFLSQGPSLLPNNAVRRWVLAGGRGLGCEGDVVHRDCAIISSIYEVSCCDAMMLV